MADDFGYHIDHHGSLVRPASLLAARAGLSGDALAAANRRSGHHARPRTAPPDAERDERRAVPARLP